LNGLYKKFNYLTKKFEHKMIFGGKLHVTCFRSIVVYFDQRSGATHPNARNTQQSIDALTPFVF
jgi:hypothetical protein